MIFDLQHACFHTNDENAYIVIKCFTCHYLKELQEVFILKMGLQLFFVRDEKCMLQWFLYLKTQQVELCQ